jgi:hypothetical protein
MLSGVSGGVEAQNDATIDDVLSSVITAAESEKEVVVSDDSESMAAEAELEAITNGTDIYVQGEF